VLDDTHWIITDTVIQQPVGERKEAWERLFTSPPAPITGSLWEKPRP